MSKNMINLLYIDLFCGAGGTSSGVLCEALARKLMDKAA